jgi:phosphoribosylamine--glycine ligase
MASAGYPDRYDIGLPIVGLNRPEADTVKVFHAGTHDRDGQVLTNGGRVLCVTALGSDIESARESVYSAIKTIHWPGSFWRDDIGHRALARQKTEHT